MKSSKLSQKNYLVLVYIVLQTFKSNLNKEHWNTCIAFLQHNLNLSKPRKQFWYLTVDMILDAQALFYSHSNSPSGVRKTRWICKAWRCYWKQIWSVEDCGLWWRAHSLQQNTYYEWFPQNNRNKCSLSTLIHSADGTLILMLKARIRNDAQEQFNAILSVRCACVRAGRGYSRGLQSRFLPPGRRHVVNGCRLSPSSSCDTILVS